MKKDERNIDRKAAVGQRVMNSNTHLCVTLKTRLLSDRQARNGRDYVGVLRRDDVCEEYRYDDHFTFTEALPPSAARRYPLVYRGWYVNVHRHADGALYPSFKRVPIKRDTDVADFIRVVSLELRDGLKGLAGK